MKDWFSAFETKVTFASWYLPFFSSFLWKPKHFCPKALGRSLALAGF